MVVLWILIGVKFDVWIYSKIARCLIFIMTLFLKSLIWLIFGNFKLFQSVCNLIIRIWIASIMVFSFVTRWNFKKIMKNLHICKHRLFIFCLIIVCSVDFSFELIRMLGKVTLIGLHLVFKFATLAQSLQS